MRLTCPNCEAQYEIDDALIPAGGRQVQCSACGDRWRQTPQEIAAPPKPEPELVPAPPTQANTEAAAGAPKPQETSEPAGPVPPTPQPEQPRVAAPQAEPPNAEASPTAVSPNATPRRPLDPKVQAILREEAARDAEARRPPQSPGDDTGLSRLPPTPVRARATTEVREPAPAVRADEATADDPGFAPGQGADPERVNKRLREVLDREIAARIRVERETRGRRRRRGFWAGFGLVALVAAAAIAIYLSAQRIVAEAPESAAALESYVGWVNSVRDETERAIEDTTDLLQDLISGAIE